MGEEDESLLVKSAYLGYERSFNYAGVFLDKLTKE